MPVDLYNDPGAEKRGEIMRRINQALPGADTIKPGKALALTADNKVVDHDHPDAEFVLVGEHGTLPADLAKELHIKEHKRSDEEEEAAQSRINAGRGNVGPVAPASTTPAANVEAPATDLVGGTVSFGGGGKK